MSNQRSGEVIRNGEFEQQQSSTLGGESSPTSENFYDPTSEEIMTKPGGGNEMTGDSSESKEYDGDDDVEDNAEKGQPPAGAGAPPKKVSFFSKEFKSERAHMFKFILFTLLFICVVILLVLSLYWGSYYQRESRIGNLRALVYNYDQPQRQNSPNTGLVGQALIDSLPKNSLGWEIRNETLTIEEIKHQVHEENAWIAVVVLKNATDALSHAFETADSNFNKTGLVQVIYERERDLTSFSMILPELNRLEATFQGMGAQSIYGPILQALNDTQTRNVMSKASQLLTSPLQFEMTDLSTYAAAILIAPLQVGLIYLIIIAFFQFNFFTALNQRIGPQLTPLSNIFCRITVAYLSYFVISLFISLVSLAFQIKFGNAGNFVAYFIISFIAMSALGFVLEIAAMLIITVYPPGLGFFLLFWVIWNISPAFSALELCPGFYKYGYGFPVYNAVSAMRCFVAGTTRKNVGRNVGILIAWNVVGVLCFPFALRYFATTMAKKAAAAQKK